MLWLCRSLARCPWSRSASVLLGSSEEQPAGEPKSPRTPYYALLGRQRHGAGTHLSVAFIDSCTKIAFAGLYDRKARIIAADLLHDRVLPFYAPRCAAPRARSQIRARQ